MSNTCSAAAFWKDLLHFGVLPRTTRAECAVSPTVQHVSDECKDLLRGLLTADPAKRLTVTQVQNHPWFRRDLPAGALEVNSRLKLMDNVR